MDKEIDASVRTDEDGQERSSIRGKWRKSAASETERIKRANFYAIAKQHELFQAEGESEQAFVDRARAALQRKAQLNLSLEDITVTRAPVLVAEIVSLLAPQEESNWVGALYGYVPRIGLDMNVSLNTFRMRVLECNSFAKDTLESKRKEPTSTNAVEMIELLANVGFEPTADLVPHAWVERRIGQQQESYALGVTDLKRPFMSLADYSNALVELRSFINRALDGVEHGLDPKYAAADVHINEALAKFAK